MVNVPLAAALQPSIREQYLYSADGKLRDSPQGRRHARGDQGFTQSSETAVESVLIGKHSRGRQKNEMWTSGG